MATAKMMTIQTPGAMRSHEGLGLLAMSSLTQVMGASIFWLPAIHLAAPRAMPIMPMVTMNGTSRSRVTRPPLAIPTTPPVRTPRRTATSGAAPALTAYAAMTLDRAMLEAAERSMPPLMMINVMPSAPRATMTDWVATL